MAKRSEKAPAARRHRTKFELESIHVDELLTAAGMSGYLSVMEPPAQSPAHLERLAEEMLAEYQARSEAIPPRYREALAAPETGVPQTGIPPMSTPEASAPVSSTRTQHTQPTKGRPETGIPESGVPERGVPDPSGPKLPIAPVLLRKPTIRQAVLVQDGHSFGEQAVYDALWHHGQPYDADSRALSIGYRTLSQICKLTVNNCKANLQALVRKLAVAELGGYGPTQAKTYQVFSYNAILRRRRQAGLTHYVKTRGVTFVDPVTGADLLQTGIPESGTPEESSGSHSGIPNQRTPEPETGTPQSGVTGAPLSATPSLEQLVRQGAPSQTSSSLPYHNTRAALERVTGPVDDDAVLRLVYACLNLAPDIADEELAALVQLKVELLDLRRVHNPVGLLLVAVPKLLEGDGIERFRLWRSERAQLHAPQGDLRKDLLQLAEDPASTEEDRKFARRVLAQVGGV